MSTETDSETAQTEVWDSTFTLRPIFIFMMGAVVLTTFLFMGIGGVWFSMKMLPLLVLGAIVVCHVVKRENPWRSYQIQKDKLICVSDSKKLAIAFTSIVRIQCNKEGVWLRYRDQDGRFRSLSMFLGKRAEEVCRKLENAMREHSTPVSK
ncbi:MAG: hypothetical protein ACOX9C_12305 [Kiritimatiellia bacterium]|jgi:hypothetical protein